MSAYANLSWILPALPLGLSFALSLSVALVYTRLSRDTGYSRPFAQSLAVAGVVSCLVVLSIGDSIARGIGLVGALTVIRFRSTLKDPRDLIFAFAALATGVAAGAQAFVVAGLGTATFLMGMVLVSLPWFGSTDPIDAILSMRTSGDPDGAESISRVLRARCAAFSLVRVRQTGTGEQEHAYQVRLKAPADRAGLVAAIEQVTGVGDAMLVAYDGLEEY